MLPLLRYLRKKSINFSIYDEIINKKDDVFELKKLIMEKYKLLIKTRRNSIDNIQEKILVESSFVNNKYFLPPLVENNKYSKKLENLENKEIYLLLFIVLLTPSLIADERINFGIGNISCEGDIKNKYTSMLENVVDSLILSEKQKNMIVKWKRLGNEIKMFPNNFTDYTSSNIIQGFIGDCSFIVVLSLLLEHEKKYKSNLLTDLISPIRLPIKNERNLEVNIKKSVINNNVLCLYSCKIIFNGIWRNIYVDNLIPIDSNNNCLLSHFDDNKYYGVTLIEKAYLKVMANRYDSVGSNPAIDLFYLTGWIPETITINSKSAKKKNYFLNVWNRIKNSFKNGSCLVALGTNDLNKSNSLLEEQKTVNNKIIREEICNKTGLVTKHAYQLLRMVEIYDYKKDCIIRILLVRNPWGKISWKGKYSAYDKINWNNELSELLGYNISQIKDNGIFWIEWSEITKWFSHIYLAWDPDKITKYTSKFHGKWNSSLHNTILKDDLHLLYFYPQYKISIDYKNFNKLFKNNTSDRLCVSQNGALKNKLSENSNYSLYFDSNSQTVNEATNYLKNGIFGLLKKRIESEYNDEFSNNNLGDIWIVLNRHIDSIEHNDKCEESNVPYMSISIYRGKERLVTQERLPIMQGIYSNGNVVTYKTNIISLLREYESYNFEENQEFILVITQYESKSSFNYTLNIYSNVEINVKPIDNEFVNTQMSDLNGILSSHINVKYYELSGKILFSNQNERYCIDLYSDQKIQITPILKNKFNFSNSNVLNNKINNQKYILLILLETKECSGEFKMKFIPELYQFRENISKLGSSNDNYFNSNCKYIKVVCTNGRYILYVDFKDKRNHIKKGMLFKVIIYLKKI
ncbi:hypothetical protein FG386_002607 [Cryptosporidium ryanae]|uniref:uncharacterized protein n=1 Tax=Cryptosporidium ryanae TaxID=515981 RepID=UPI00351A4E5E|nr:hypothetical protein FG386_002607 [Cryptosporidium ryanae]